MRVEGTIVGTVEDEFSVAYLDMGKSAYRAAYRLLGDRSEADDIACEAAARAFAHWRAARANPEAWVVVVATRLALDHLRRVGRADRGQRRVLEQPAPEGAWADRLALRAAISHRRRSRAESPIPPRRLSRVFR